MLIPIHTKEDRLSALTRAAGVILSGGIVAFPTESFYGLAVNAEHEGAIQRLLAVKKRGSDQPILILISDLDILDRYVADIPETARALINHLWPGGLTLVFRAKPTVSTLLTTGTGKIGVRLSSHPIARDLGRAAGLAITGTSANVSGGAPCMDAMDVWNSLGDQVDLILDGGKTEGGKGSTVLDVTVQPPRVLRDGMVGVERLRSIVSCHESVVKRP